MKKMKQYSKAAAEAHFKKWQKEQVKMEWNGDVEDRAPNGYWVNIESGEAVAASIWLK